MLSTLPGEAVPAPPMLWSGEEIFSLAAGSQVNDEKPHQGVKGKNAAPHQGAAACNSTTALGVSWRLWSGTASGATVTYEYDAFGNLLNKTGTTPNSYLYRGEQYDPDLGLYYLRARYYNPTTGRFMSRDPNAGKLVDPESLHKYLYAEGDPIDAKDPSGRGSFREYAFAVSLISAYVIQYPGRVAWVVAKALCTAFELEGLLENLFTTGKTVVTGEVPEGPDAIEALKQVAESFCSGVSE